MTNRLSLTLQEESTPVPSRGTLSNHHKKNRVPSTKPFFFIFHDQTAKHLEKYTNKCLTFDNIEHSGKQGNIKEKEY